MSNFVHPIHIEGIGLCNLRFFAPTSGKPEFPWVAVDDLHACLALPRALRREFKSKIRSSKWHPDTCTVTTAEGIVDLVPHYQAQGFIGAMTEVGRCPADFHDQYCRAGATAATNITQHLSPEEFTAYMQAAWESVGGRPNEGGAHG